MSFESGMRSIMQFPQDGSDKAEIKDKRTPEDRSPRSGDCEKIEDDHQIRLAPQGVSRVAGVTSTEFEEADFADPQDGLRVAGPTR